MINPLPTITTKQQEILKLIYRYRFLNRTQIQTLLKHKDKRRIISWLKDLREKQYADWHYDASDLIAKSRPAIYYLALNGIRRLRESGDYPAEELRKRYKEPTRSEAFIARCLLITDCCIVLEAKSKEDMRYSCVLVADYAGFDNERRFLQDLKPQLYFVKHQKDQATEYVLESFEASLPRYQFRKRVRAYMEFLSDHDDYIALFICANVADLLYLKRYVGRILGDVDDELTIRATTLEKVKVSGVASPIWEGIS